VVTLHGNPGDMIAVGAPLISIEVREPGASSGSGNVLVGYGPNESPVERRQRVTAAGSASGPPPAASGTATAPASPLVRRLAAERGIDLSTITGTGPGGVITRADLEGAAGQADGERPVRERLVGVDRVAAERLTRSHQEIPTATATLTVEAGELLAVRERANAQAPGVHVTPFAVLLSLCVRALRQYPRLNAHFNTAANEIVRFEPVHLGVAVQTERGLVVPVVRGAQGLTLLQLAAELERVAGAARAGSIAAAELTGSTFTVSNFGAFGVDGGTALINPPEVAILGVGRIVQRPWNVDGALALRAVVELSLVFDHRVADGGVGGGFLKHLGDLIEHPGEL